MARASAAKRALAKPSSSKSSQPKVSAQDSIRNTSGVGVDLRTARKTAIDEDDESEEESNTAPKPLDPPIPPQTFLKPVGVDEPSRTSNPLAKTTKRDEIIRQARRDVKSKREREFNDALDADSVDTEDLARKRKKKKNAANTSS